MTIPIPLWVVLGFLALIVGQQWAAAVQTRALRDLYDLYLRERLSDGGASPEAETPAASVETPPERPK
jgi:hypothetical protein